MKIQVLSVLGFLFISLSSGQECGVRNAQAFIFRIDNDNETLFGEFPWMVSVLTEEHLGDSSETYRVYKCGGSIIHPQAIITSAECVKSQEQKYIVRGGEWDISTIMEIYPHQDRIVKTIITHPEYNTETANNDIALVILENPLDTTAENVGCVCLPFQNEILENTECYVTSWGANIEKYHTILKKYDLQVVERNNCEEQLRKTHLGRQFTLHESFICSESNNYCGAGRGDPFVCFILEKPDRYYQTGIGSWDLDCNSTNTPIVYTNVGKFRQWIDTEMGKLNFDTTSYTY